MKKLLFLCLSWAFLIACKTQNITKNPQKTEKNYVLLISFDGFRYDYPDKFNLKNFQELKQNHLTPKKERYLPFQAKLSPIITALSQECMQEITALWITNFTLHQSKKSTLSQTEVQCKMPIFMVEYHFGNGYKNTASRRHLIFG